MQTGELWYKNTETGKYWRHRVAPDWWAAQNVFHRGDGVMIDDYAVVNQGQLKHIAYKAFLEMDSRCFPGGVGEDLKRLIQGWNTPVPVGSSPRDDYQAVNVGQAKHIASLFYDRLIDLGHENSYVWEGREGAPDDYALVNIGQIKYLFSFRLGMYDPKDPEDWNMNGIGDWWEQQWFPGVESLDPQAIGFRQEDGGDGFTHKMKYLLGFNPTQPALEGSDDTLHLNIHTPSN